MNTATKILNQLFTGKDNYTQDIARWLAALSVIVFLGLEIYQVVWAGRVFEMRDFGEGIGLVFTAAGAWIKMKETSEPDAPPATIIDQKPIDNSAKTP